MSDYTQVTDFSAKDGLSSGDPEKLILGSDVDGEFGAIATAIATKYDSADLASQAQAEAETDNTVLLTPLRLAQWADANGGMVGDIQALADPNADTLLGWDDSAGAAIGFTFSGSGIAFGDGTVGLEAGLEAIAGLAKTDGNVIVGNGSTWVAEQPGTTVQAWDANLDQIAALAVTDGNFIVGNGSAWVAESGATARTSLGLGSIATQAASSVSITGGTITGTTFTGSFGGSIDAGDNSITQIAALFIDERASAPTNVSSELGLWVEDATDGNIHLECDSGTTRVLPGMQIIQKGADETVNNSTTLQDDDHFTGIVMLSSKRYRVVLRAEVSQSSATPDFKANLAIPSGSFLSVKMSMLNVTNSNNVYGAGNTSSSDAVSCDATTNHITVEWIVDVNVGASDAKIQWAQNTANASNTTLTADSTLEVYELIDNV